MLKELDTLRGIIQEGDIFQCGLTEQVHATGGLAAAIPQLQLFSTSSLICLHSRTCGVCSKALQLTILLPQRVLVHVVLYNGVA